MNFYMPLGQADPIKPESVGSSKDFSCTIPCTTTVTIRCPKTGNALMYSLRLNVRDWKEDEQDELIDKMAKVPKEEEGCTRDAVFHSIGNSAGGLHLLENDGRNYPVLAQDLVRFLWQFFFIGGSKWYREVTFLCSRIGLGNFIDEFAEKLSKKQQHGVTVYGAKHWVDNQEGSLVLVKGNPESKKAHETVDGGSLESAKSFSEWVNNSDNFKRVEV